MRDLITLSLQQRQNKKMKFEYPKWPGERARNDLHSVIRYSSARSVSAQRGAFEVKIFHQFDVLIFIFRMLSGLAGLK